MSVFFLSPSLLLLSHLYTSLFHSTNSFFGCMHFLCTQGSFFYLAVSSNLSLFLLLSPSFTFYCMYHPPLSDSTFVSFLHSHCYFEPDLTLSLKIMCGERTSSFLSYKFKPYTIKKINSSWPKQQHCYSLL